MSVSGIQFVDDTGNGGMKHITALVILSLGYITVAQQVTWYVEGIHFLGNDNIDRSELISFMQLQPPEFFTRSEYSFSKLVDDISAIKRYYHRKGYLGVNVRIAGIERDTTVQGVIIRLQINEGIQTIVDSIAFSGNTIFTDSALSKFIPLHEKSPLDSIIYERSGRVIKDSLASRGYLFAKVNRSIQINDKQESAVVTYEIEEGPVVLQGDLEIVGAENFKRKVIEREVVFEKGAVLTTYGIARSIQRLYGTGLFNYVLIEPLDTVTIPSDMDTIRVPVLIQLNEADMFSIQLGGGYNTEDGLYGTIETSYANLFSLGHRISSSIRLSFDLIGARLIYSWPWVFGLPHFADVSAYIDRQEEIDFSGLFTGGFFSLTSHLNIRSFYRTWIQVENTLWLHDRAPDQDISDNIRGNIVLLGAGYTRDLRNTILNPGSGFFGFVEGEIAGPWISWSDKFYRFRGDLRGYYSLLKGKITFSSALFSGYVKEYGGDDNVPPQELFRVGEDGVRPVRGYDDEDVVFPDENTGGGTFALIITPIELLFPIYRILAGALFVDCGVIWQSPDDIGLSDLRWSVGPGLRLVDLPIGIVRLDYGIRLDGDLDLEGRIHFGIGATF